MATIAYVTLKMPDVLWAQTEVIQKTPNFEVRRYKHKKGILFRVPHGVKENDICHAFMEHEINLSNTIRTGTITMKIQVTFIPCHIGVFSGFKVLEGHYDCEYDDEYMEYGSFVPEYDSPDTIKNIIPLPPNIKSNLSEYLNEILFKYCDNADLIHKYAVDLGCQKEKLKANFIPAPEQASTTKKGIKAFNATIDFFNEITTGQMNMLPEVKSELCCNDCGKPLQSNNSLCLDCHYKMMNEQAGGNDE